MAQTRYNPPPTSPSPPPIDHLAPRFTAGNGEDKQQQSPPQQQYSMHAVPLFPTRPPQPPNPSLSKADDYKARAYDQPPPTKRIPAHIFNQDCGAIYHGAAQVGNAQKADILRLVGSTKFNVLCQLLIIYKFRCNTIKNAHDLNKEAMAKIHGIHLFDFLFNVTELYKRLAMRQKVFTQNQNVNDYNFNKLPAEELEKFIDFLRDISATPLQGGAGYNLFRFGIDVRGNPYIQIKANPMTIALIQVANALDDGLNAIKRVHRGADYLRAIRTGADYFFS